MDQPSDLQTPPETSPTQPMTLGGRLFNVFATPGEVFENVRNTPATESNWLVPALLVMVLGWVAVALTFSQESIKYQVHEMTEKAVQKQIEKQHMSDSQAEQTRQAAEKFGDMGMKISGVMMPALMAWLTPFWWGFILWLVGKYAFNAEFTFMKGVEAAGLSCMVMVLD